MEAIQKNGEMPEYDDLYKREICFTDDDRSCPAGADMCLWRYRVYLRIAESHCWTAEYLIEISGIDCGIAHAFGSGEDVLRYLQDHIINILFLDIDMPEMNGFSLASSLRERYPDTIIIFVSAYDDFVYSSFEYAPFRFLRKSHLEEELPITFQKVIEKYMYDSEVMSFDTTDGEVMLRLRDILYFEGEKNYYAIKMLSNITYRCRGTMASIEERLKPYDFFRVHSAFIVNEEHIQSIHDKGDLTMKDGVTITVSRRKMAAFKEAYMQFTRRRFARW